MRGWGWRGRLPRGGKVRRAPRPGRVKPGVPSPIVLTMNGRAAPILEAGALGLAPLQACPNWVESVEMEGALPTAVMKIAVPKAPWSAVAAVTALECGCGSNRKGIQKYQL